MKMKKTWFSYLLWLMYTALTGVLFSVCVTSVSAAAWGLGKYMTVGAVCVSFALIGGIWAAGRKVCSSLAGCLPEDPHFYHMWECFLAMCVFAGAVLYRMYYLLHADISPDTGIYFELAQVKAADGIPQITHGASYVYTVVLSTLFSFLDSMGSKVTAGIFFQFFLQMLSLPVFYFAVRLLAGRLPALTAAAFFAFSPVFLESMYGLSPENLYLLFYATGLLLMGLYLYRIRRDGFRSKAAWAACLLIGLYAGLTVYLDVMGATLLFFAGTAFTVFPGASGGKSGKEPLVRLGVIVSGTLLGTGGLFWADAAYSGRPFSDIASAWLYQYAGRGGLSLRLSEVTVNPAAGIPVYGAAALLAVGFWFHKTQKSDAFIFLLLALAVCGIFGIGQMDYGIFTAAIWGVLFGLGPGSIPADREGTEKIMQKRKTVTAAAKKGQISALSPTESGRGKAADWEDGLEEVMIEKKQEKQEEKQPVRFLENPLPLPKKHVKKEMDFGVEIKENQHGFDQDVAEDDDFDLR